MREALRVLKPGLLTTIQDPGRRGHLAMGISPAGAMDPFAFRMANALAGNPETAAALEITYVGPELLALSDVTVSLTGADLSPMIDGRPVPMWQAHRVRRDSIISFGPRRWGCRLYLAVAGGICAPETFGSSSTDVRCRLGPPLLTGGDIVTAGFSGSHPPASADVSSLQDVYEPRGCLRAATGPEEHFFTSQAIETFFNATYAVTSHSDRSGIRLSGPGLERAITEDLYSTAMLTGNIQVPPNGQPIVLGVEHQSVGGYPRIGFVIRDDFPKLAQLFMNEPVRFKRVDPDHRL